MSGWLARFSELELTETRNLCFRRKHKKGQEEEQTKKRTRRTQKFQRAIVGASLTDILAKRNMKPEIRKAQREQAIKYVFFSIMFVNSRILCSE